jgi:hypothetical protein
VFTLKQAQEIVLSGDVYTARVRAPQNELLYNFGYSEVRAMSVPGAAQTSAVKFPGGDFSIHEWHVRPDGAVSYLFSPDDLPYALRIDHLKGVAAQVALPADLGVPSGLSWWSPRFAVLNTNDRVWVDDGATFVLATPAEADATYTRAFRRITRRFAVIKGDPYSRGVYVLSREYETKTIGFIPFADDGAAAHLVEHDGSAVDVAVYRDALFVSFEREVVQHREGRSEVVFTPGDDEQIIRVNVIESSGAACLAVVLGGEDHLNAPQSRLVLLEIAAPVA